MQRDSGSPAALWPGYVGLLGLILLFAGLGIDVLHQINRGKGGAEMTYYHAANALRHGHDPYVGGHDVFPYIYPPLYAFCFQPLTHLSSVGAARVMAAIDGGFILAALLLSTRSMLCRFGASSRWTTLMPVALIAGVIVAVPIHNEWRGLETNSILLLSFALALHWLDKRPILAGLALAVAINIKYLPIIAVPYFILRRRWVAAGATILGSVAVALIPAVSLGWSTNAQYVHEAVSGLGHLASADPTQVGAARVNTTGDLSSLSITSAATRLAEARSWPHVIALAIVAVVAGVWLGMILLNYHRRHQPILRWPAAAQQQAFPLDWLVAVEWAALATFALAFSPNTQNRNLVLAIIPAAFSAVLLCTSANSRARLIALAASVIMCIGLVLPVAAMGKPFTVTWLSAGGPCWMLLGAFLLLVIAALTPSPLRVYPESTLGGTRSRGAGAETVDNLGVTPPV